jgi:hypothetical protein
MQRSNPRAAYAVRVVRGQADADGVPLPLPERGRKH